MGALLCALGGTGCQSAVARDAPVDGTTIGTTRSELFVLQTTLWKTPGNIPVCWEAAGFATEKAWVASAIKASWETATSALKFTGWGTCTTASKGIRIVINSNSPDGPHVEGFGSELDGLKNGMTLDFAFSSGAFPQCVTSAAMRERCVRAIATHEFGHAIGFLHEQERVDTPASCPDREPTTDTAGTTTVGAWDLMSIMNYCYPDRDNVFPTALSPTDIKGARQMYPPPVATPPATPTEDPTDADPQATDLSDDVTDPAEEEEEEVVTPKKKKKTVAPQTSAGCTTAPSRQGAPGSGALLVVAACVMALRLRRRSAE